MIRHLGKSNSSEKVDSEHGIQAIRSWGANRLDLDPASVHYSLKKSDYDR